MLNRIIGLLCLLANLTQPVMAHYEDPVGCDRAFKHMPDDGWTLLYAGISEDGRDFIYRFLHTDKAVLVEEHHILLPRNQWDNENDPRFMMEILSMWIDANQDGHYEEWFLFPRNQSDCADAIHFKWDSTRQSYVLYDGGKERT